LQYTGGTTGAPKGVMLSHRNLLSNVVQLEAWFRTYAGGRAVSLDPAFFHVFGDDSGDELDPLTGCTVILVLD